jgi:hypothetical protein
MNSVTQELLFQILSFLTHKMDHKYVWNNYDCVYKCIWEPDSCKQMLDI